MDIKTKFIIILIFLGLIDAIIPFPIIGVILIYIILQKPLWFKELVSEIYNEENNEIN